MNCDAGKSGTGHHSEERGGDRRGDTSECPWNRFLGPAPITSYRLLLLDPGPSIIWRRELCLDRDRYYWYNLIIQKNKYILTYL